MIENVLAKAGVLGRPDEEHRWSIFWPHLLSWEYEPSFLDEFPFLVGVADRALPKFAPYDSSVVVVFGANGRVSSVQIPR